MKKALVLSGGGAKGSYQIGVWKALRRLNMKFDIVTGTSIGSFNGALYAMGNFRRARRVWLKMSSSDLFHLDNVKEMAKELIKNKGMRADKATEYIYKILSENKIRKSKIDYGLVTFSLKTLNPKMITKEEMPNGKLIEYVIASCTCFPAVEKKEIDGEYFVDGGYYDNMPINLAIEMGAQEILAVDLSAFGVYQKPKDNNIKIDVIKNKNHALFDLSFNKKSAKRNICFGYNDTMKYFNKLDGNFYTFKKGDISKNCKKIEKKYISILNDFINNIKKSKIKNELFKISKYNNLLLDISNNKNIESYFLEYIEYLGEVFELDSSKIYNINRYNKKIIGKLNKQDLNYSKKIKGKLLINYIYFKYNENKSNEEIFNLALLFPKDFLAALYLIANTN